jgi:lipid-binding SYLF domain-containing protein
MMIRILLAAAVIVAMPLLAPRAAHAQGDQQSLVDRATLALQDMINDSWSSDPRNALAHARAVMICPQVFKAGLFFGGEGGDCVLLTRAANGTWSYPAFYGLNSGSFGLQIGLQDSQIVMMIMTQRGLNALMDSQFKFGAGAGIAIATIGAGVQGSTTGAFGADIVAFAKSRGLYGGISLEGSLMAQRSGWDRAYYGRDAGAREIVVNMQVANPGADPLRSVLTRYGSGAEQAALPPPPDQPPPGYQPGPGYQQAPVQLQPQAPVQQQNLPPPSR